MLRRAHHLPSFIEPMLCLLAVPFESTEYVYELKWDGFRALAFVDRDGLRLMGRRKTDFTARFPELQVLAQLPAGTVLDGEIIALKSNGHPDFAALLARERSWVSSTRANRLRKAQPAATFVAFDLLYDRGEPILHLPLIERHARLQKLLQPHVSARLAISEQTPGGQGLALFGAVNQLGLEGVVAKRADAPYQPGIRSGAWSKFKRRQVIDVTIFGYEANASGGIKSLIIAGEYKGETQFVGQVGSGLNDRVSTQLLAFFRQNSQKSAAYTCNIRHGRWIRPTLQGRVSFAEWTDAGRLRAPVLESVDSPADRAAKQVKSAKKRIKSATTLIKAERSDSDVGPEAGRPNDAAGRPKKAKRARR